MHVAWHLRCGQAGVTSGLWDVYSNARKLFGEPTLHGISPAGYLPAYPSVRGEFTALDWILMRFLRDHVSSVPAAASQANVRESSNVAWLKTGRRTDSLPPRNPFMKMGVGFQFTASWTLDRAGAQAELPRSCLEQHCSFYATATCELPVLVQKV